MNLLWSALEQQRFNANVRHLVELSAQLDASTDEEFIRSVQDRFAKDVMSLVRGRYLARLEALEDACRYWDVIFATRFVGLGLHAVQLAPRWIAAGVTRAVNGGERFAVWGLLKNDGKLPQWPSTPLEGISLIRSKWNSVVSNLKASRRPLEFHRDAFYEALGVLGPTKCDETFDQILDRVETSVAVISGSFDDGVSESELGGIKEALEQFAANDARLAIVLWQYSGPTTLEKYWPMLLLGFYGAWWVLGSWREILEWVRSQVWDTAASFLQNWLWEPLVQVYRTVRHDENSRVALMAKASLDSDLKSLERMVIEYARDNGSSLDLESVRNAVTSGDLSAVMMPYEQQIQTPITSLLKGSLVRSLLIQVQKTKVDIEVAMDGIDKILQSQQLVFGLVAALPALAVTWATASYTINSSKTGGAKRQFENLNQLKSRLRYRLLTLNTIVHHDGEISHEKQCGQVLYTSWRAAQAGCSYLSDVNYKFLLKDLDIIEHDVYTRPDQLTSDLDRVFLHRYF